MPGVTESGKDRQALLSGLRTAGLGVYQTSAWPLDDGHGLQCPCPGWWGAVAGLHQPAQYLPSLQVATQVPEHAKRPCRHQSGVDVTTRPGQPRDRPSDIRLFVAQQSQRLALPVAPQLDLGALG